ncbi:hypothetical protein [Gilvimarinus algae]|uniref:Uncharacterized protein n=1 Tax=Gilvimarinus algae TaxID=3058037 RepID=A0ABT8TF33_9GAMM|nr:hypothetical protein [Gilvimarinus sp. SDUM040014]MDO3380922.1 hypothetical protein [Gilvimarinus sp. SDUM040014]
MNTLRGAVYTLLVLLSAPTLGGEWDWHADAELELRAFSDTPKWPGQSDKSVHSAIALSGELYWLSESGDQRAALVPYLRHDAIDEERNLVDLKQAYWAMEYGSGALDLLIGVDKVFWGVAESTHLVDIVNQTDAVADIDGEQKLGQLMLKLSWQEDWGLLSVFALPMFRERNFAGTEGRLRAGAVIDSDYAQYEHAAEDRHLDWALRYSHYFGDLDLGLSAFKGTLRDPLLLPNADGSVLVPHYQQVDQVGIDAQYTRNAWLWKLEAVWRSSSLDNYIAAVAGFEYTHFGLFDSAADLGYLLEYQYDNRHDTEPPSIADNDVFIALRLALNDVQDSSVLTGLLIDIESDAVLFNVEAERRFGSNTVGKLRLRVIEAPQEDLILYSLQHDSYLQVSLQRYF